MSGADGPGACGLERYCHSDGSTYGLAARNAVLFGGSPHGDETGEDAEALAGELVAWITAHEHDLGLEPGLTAADVELVPAHGFVQRMGRLTVARFRQRYRGRAVLPPDDLVQVVYSPAGAVQITGRILDGRIEYEDDETQASARRARVAIRHHAHVRAQVPAGEVEVDGLTLVAMPHAQRVAWMALAKHEGSMLARVIVDADPAAGPILPLLSYRRLAVEDLAATTPIHVRTADPTGDPVMYGTSVETTLVGGGDLLGSLDDDSGEVQLATDAVVVLDLNGGSRDKLEDVASRILNPNGEFLASSGAALSGQVAHHLLHSWYARLDGYMTDPISGTKRWDSAVPVYLPMSQSPTPAGTFAPRVLVFMNSASSDCPVTGVACADFGGYGSGSDQAMAFPEVAHQPLGASGFEFTGEIILPGETLDHLSTLAHELGHVVDLFAGPGMSATIAPDCGGACASECVEDTSDEAPPLGETISQMFGLLLLRDSFEPVDFEYCGVVGLISRNNVNAFDPGPCIPAGEDISLLQRPDACVKPAPYCDKPAEPGFELYCCDPAVDVGCIVHAPADCDSGFMHQVPTGLCHTSPGYNTHSVLQAYWQMLHGQRCEPTAPFDCEAFEWAPDIEPADVAVPAFLYSLRLNPLSYQQLIDGMATYIACNHSSDAYDVFNQIACAHGLQACGEAAPLLCEVCGNGVREGSETCDGLDWAVVTCSDAGDYVGGALQCDQATCELDFSLCDAGNEDLDTTAGTGQAPAEATTEATSTETDDGLPGASGDGGCSCQAAPWGGSLPWLLMPLAAISRCRPRSPA